MEMNYSGLNRYCRLMLHESKAIILYFLVKHYNTKKKENRGKIVTALQSLISK